MKRFRTIITLCLMSTVLFTACSLSNSSAGKTATATSSFSGTAPAAQSSPALGTTPAAQSSPVGTPGGIMLAPPLLVAHAASGTQQANYGSFYWMLDSGLAAQVNARGIEIQKNALEVKKGESLQFTWTEQNSKSDSTLQELTIAVYPKDQSIATVTSAQGNMTGFKPSGDPVTSGTLSTTNPSWTANVDSGSYFVLVKATWSNPVVADKTRNSEYGFLFKVG